MATKDKEKKPTVIKEKLSGFVFDLAKLVFGGLVVGTLTPLVTKDFENLSIELLIAGIVATLSFALFATWLLKVK